ncbi:MAG TPA: hypothetical protein PLT66_08395 [Bacillota bacterium]|nr:hypothetical protein [Bacillota bacterium]
MTERVTKRCFDRPPPAPEKQEKLDLSAREVVGLTKRDVHCPKCEFVVDRVYSDAVGHKDVKCQKCKFEGPINISYFRSQKGIWYLRWLYYGDWILKAAQKTE